MYKIYKENYQNLPEDEKKIIEAAISVRKYGYSTRSGSKVGAAIQTDSGDIFSGTNVSNTTSTLTVHAEVAAAVNAVSNGFKKFKKIAVVPFEKIPKEDISQCGVCLQFLSEFSDRDFKFIVTDEQKSIVLYTFFSEIFPNPFGEPLKESMK